MSRRVRRQQYNAQTGLQKSDDRKETKGDGSVPRSNRRSADTDAKVPVLKPTREYKELDEMRAETETESRGHGHHRDPRGKGERNNNNNNKIVVEEKGERTTFSTTVIVINRLLYTGKLICLALAC